MTSIGATGGSSCSSARSVIQSEILSRVSSASSQKALTSAVDDIESALESMGGLGASSSSPSAMKSKVESLIDAQVESGKLDAAQAADLKQVFSDVAAGAEAGTGDGQLSNFSSDSSIDEIFREFVSSLQKSQSSSGYGATGSVQSISISLVVDYKA